jgi:hypothetical protein
MADKTRHMRCLAHGSCKARHAELIRRRQRTACRLAAIDKMLNATPQSEFEQSVVTAVLDYVRYDTADADRVDQSYVDYITRPLDISLQLQEEAPEATKDDCFAWAMTHEFRVTGMPELDLQLFPTTMDGPGVLVATDTLHKGELWVQIYQRI